jgi:hypothetical protein
MNNNQIAIDRVSTAAVVVGNIRLDQGWGFAGLHGMVGNNSLYTNATVNTSSTNAFGVITAPSTIIGQRNYGGWGVGSTVSFKLPMLAQGDQIWFTANYMSGMLGAIASTGGLSVVNSGASDKRLLSGIVRVDNNIVLINARIPTISSATPAVYVPGLLYEADVSTGWNVAMAMTHYWAPQWRSNFGAAYIELSPPTSTLTSAWGKGKFWEVGANIIYSPVKDFDIGLEVLYANLKNKVQNPTAAFLAAGSPGLSENVITTKLRIERQF